MHEVTPFLKSTHIIICTSLKDLSWRRLFRIHWKGNAAFYPGEKQ